MSKTNKIIAFGAVAVVAILAAIKNPSSTESSQMVKDKISALATDKMIDKIGAEDSEKSGAFASTMARMFAPTVIDKLLDVEVNDYVVFSTFKATASFGEESKNVASGLILFGNIIPLSSGLKE